jgi:hypothetical protein
LNAGPVERVRRVASDNRPIVAAESGRDQAAHGCSRALQQRVFTHMRQAVVIALGVSREVVCACENTLVHRPV